MIDDFSPPDEAKRLEKWILQTCLTQLNREGGVIGVSGGVDSATVLYLAVRALGNQRVAALIMPERDSNPQSASLAMEMAAQLGVTIVHKDLTNILDAYGCYESRNEAVRHSIPEFNSETDKFKIVLPQNLLTEATLNVFSLVVIKPDGRQVRRRLTPANFKTIVAASNLKQRTRMAVLYYEAERRNYAVIGTANKNEHDLGFFVKYGDGGVDLQPIRHLFKTQVYALARYLGVPNGIVSRLPTTDTYSADTTQEEFFYRLPFDLLDTIWKLDQAQQTMEQIARITNLSPDQVENVVLDLRSKQRTTEYLRIAPLSPD